MIRITVEKIRDPRASRPCHLCGSSSWWFRPGGTRAICQICHPDPNRKVDSEEKNETVNT